MANFQEGLVVSSLANGLLIVNENLGYQVTFKIDNNVYYVAQCLKGDKIVEPPVPTGVGIFDCWVDNDGNNINFPYTPLDDIELSALFNSNTN